MTLPQIEMVPLSKIKDNPWRDKKRNPINPENVAHIQDSIIRTGEFWVGVYGRKVAGGYVELAFGHQRTDAAKAVDTGDAIEAAKHAGLKAIPVAIRDFTDGDMLVRMVCENTRGELPVVLEAVSAAVRALAEGKIELATPDPKTNDSAIRYAPSFVPGRASSVTSEATHAYTASTLAKFLGGIYTKAGTRDGQVQASNSVVAALGILELEERKVAGFSSKTYADQPISKIIPMVSEIKKRTEEVQERRGKSAEEINKLREEQLAMQKKMQADAKKADEEHKALLKKLADATRAENDKKADELKAKLKSEDKRAQEKEVLNKLRAAELEEKLEKKRAWEAEQRQQDQYQPLRRDVENFIGRYEMKITERNPEREEVKALNRTLTGGVRLTPADRARAQRAVRDYASWLYDWVLPQLAPELKSAQKRTVEERKATQPKPKTKGGA